jgi:hypothetical protein
MQAKRVALERQNSVAGHGSILLNITADEDI